MSFCSSCGAENTADARFCNKCGAKIGDAAAAPAPPAAPSSTNITLAGIGIRSQRQTNTVLAIGALLFLGLGAAVALVLMRSAGTTVAAEATPTPPASDAIPAGVDVPEGDFVMTSGARVVKRGGSAPAPSGAPAPSSASGSSAGASSGGAAAPTGAAVEPTAPHHHHAGTGATPPASGSSGSSDPIAPPPSGAAAGGSTSPSTGGSTPPSSSVDWTAMSDTVGDGSDDPDYQMQMYSTQVRRFIRQYLLPQATSCFEHASAASRDPVRGNVTIGFDIDARGHAQSASIDRNTTGNDGLARCLQNNVGTWQLPPPPTGTAPIQMQMPFTR